MGQIALRTQPRRSFDDIKEEPTIAQRCHHEPAPFERRIGLVVAPSAERHELIQVEVGAPLGALHDVMDIQPPPHAAGLATPARSREYLCANRRPF
jgi:hypothetical protein